MSRRAIKGKPSADTLKKRRLRARRRALEDPQAFYAARHERKHRRAIAAEAHRKLDPSERLLELIAAADEMMLL